MASSGVTVNDDVVAQFNNIKIGHKYDYIQMKMSPDLKEIVMEKCVDSGSSTYEEFVAQLPADDCRYAVYDFHFSTPKAGDREQLIFVVWCPDIAKVRTKMLYAASKDAIKKKFVGINHEIQATEHSELNKADIQEKISSRMVK